MLMPAALLRTIVASSCGDLVSVKLMPLPEVVPDALAPSVMEGSINDNLLIGAVMDSTNGQGETGDGFDRPRPYSRRQPGKYPYRGSLVVLLVPSVKVELAAVAVGVGASFTELTVIVTVSTSVLAPPRSGVAVIVGGDRQRIGAVEVLDALVGQAVQRGVHIGDMASRRDVAGIVAAHGQARRGSKMKRSVRATPSVTVSLPVPASTSEILMRLLVADENTRLMSSFMRRLSPRNRIDQRVIHAAATEMVSAAEAWSPSLSVRT